MLRTIVAAALSCAAAGPAMSAVTISFTGTSNGHDVTGYVRYDETQPVVVTATGPDSRAGFYYPNGPDYGLVFSTDGYFVNSYYVAIVADLYPQNSGGYGDAINFQASRGGSGREQFAFGISYDSPDVWSDTALPASPPPGAGLFSYSYAGRGYSIPVTWVAQAGLLPEPASWALLIGGFGLVGATLRARPRLALVA